MKKHDTAWLIPFDGRKTSGTYNVNFLWKEDQKNIYIMDNHRTALWCWFQHLKENEHVNYFHLDRHYDTLQSNIDAWIKLCPDLFNITLDDYLQFEDRSDPNFPYRLFRWDNYGSIFLEKYSNLINSSIFCTYKDGDEPNQHVREVDSWELIDNFDYWIENQNEPWICNIDLDYFFRKIFFLD